MRWRLLAAGTIIAAGAITGPARAALLPTNQAQTIAGILGTRAYLPSWIPPGFLYTNSERKTFLGAWNVVIDFADAGKRLTWQVSAPDSAADCTLNSLATERRLGALKVHMLNHTAWLCFGSGRNQYEVSAESGHLPLATLERIVASARVAPQLPTPQITLTQSSFQSQSDLTGGSLLSWEVELRNTSSAVDAIDVTIKATFVDDLGRSLATDTVQLTGIPAGGTVYATGLASSNVTLTPSSLQSSIQIGWTQPAALQLPPVSAISVQTNSFGSPTVTGSLTNPYNQAISGDATIYGIFLDGQGNILGGDSEDTGATVEPHATVGFAFDAAPQGTVSALITVDPCDAFRVSLGESCPALG